MKATLSHKKWWHRLIPKRRRELKTQELIINHIIGKPDVQQKVWEGVVDTIVNGEGYQGEMPQYPIYFDEAGSFPDYKWYRNPIKWWKWRRMSRSLKKQLKKWKKEGKAWTSFDL